MLLIIVPLSCVGLLIICLNVSLYGMYNMTFLELILYTEHVLIAKDKLSSYLMLILITNNNALIGLLSSAWACLLVIGALVKP